MEIQVNNDTPDRTNPGSIGINKMEITTKLLVADGDIVCLLYTSDAATKA